MKSEAPTRNSNLYIYTVEGALIKTTTVAEFAKSCGKSANNIIAIATSIKGYGFINEVFISVKPLERLLTIKEVIKLFDDWLIKAYAKNVKKLKAMYRKNYNYDYLSDAIYYVTKAINSPRSVNNFEQALIYKYKTSMIDDSRLIKNKKKKEAPSAKNGWVEVSDITYKDDNGNEYSYIQNIAAEGDSFFDTDSTYDCVTDYNSIKQFDVIGYVLKEKFDAGIVDMFVEVLQKNYDFKNLDELPEFKYMTLFKPYRLILSECKKQDEGTCNMSNSAYFEYMIKLLWSELSTSVERIKQEAEHHTFKNIDDYGLRELIQ